MMPARQIRIWRVFPVLLAGLMTCAAPPMLRAEQPCGDLTVSGLPHLEINDDYNPFAPTDLTQTTIITIRNGSDTACRLALVLTTQTDGALSSNGNTISYQLETIGGAPLLNPQGLIDPAAGHYIDVAVGPGEAASVSLRARLPAGQVAPPGRYSDSSVMLRLYASPGNGVAQLREETAFPVFANVAPVCQMAMPQQDVLSFSSDIGAQGRPRGEWRSLSVPGATCNTGARLSLRASALSRRNAQTLPGLDNFIDLEARAIFSGVTTALTTQGPDQPNEAEASIHEHSAAAGAIDLTVRLVPGRTLVPGHYQSVLTLRLEPSH